MIDRMGSANTTFLSGYELTRKLIKAELGDSLVLSNLGGGQITEIYSPPSEPNLLIFITDRSLQASHYWDGKLFVDTSTMELDIRVAKGRLKVELADLKIRGVHYRDVYYQHFGIGALVVIILMVIAAIIITTVWK